MFSIINRIRIYCGIDNPKENAKIRNYSSTAWRYNGDSYPSMTTKPNIDDLFNLLKQYDIEDDIVVVLVDPDDYVRFFVWWTASVLPHISAAELEKLLRHNIMFGLEDTLAFERVGSHVNITSIEEALKSMPEKTYDFIDVPKGRAIVARGLNIELTLVNALLTSKVGNVKEALISFSNRTFRHNLSALAKSLVVAAYSEPEKLKEFLGYVPPAETPLHPSDVLTAMSKLKFISRAPWSFRTSCTARDLSTMDWIELLDDLTLIESTNLFESTPIDWIRAVSEDQMQSFTGYNVSDAIKYLEFFFGKVNGDSRWMAPYIDDLNLSLIAYCFKGVRGNFTLMEEYRLNPALVIE